VPANATARTSDLPSCLRCLNSGYSWCGAYSKTAAVTDLSYCSAADSCEAQNATLNFQRIQSAYFCQEGGPGRSVHHAGW
jgi:hypothetical protein